MMGSPEGMIVVGAGAVTRSGSLRGAGTAGAAVAAGRGKRGAAGSGGSGSGSKGEVEGERSGKRLRQSRAGVVAGGAGGMGPGSGGSGSGCMLPPRQHSGGTRYTTRRSLAGAAAATDVLDQPSQQVGCEDLGLSGLCLLRYLA
jgi:hypothetical protein